VAPPAPPAHTRAPSGDWQTGGEPTRAVAAPAQTKPSKKKAAADDENETDPAAQAAAAEKAKKVRSMMSKDPVGALKVALESPPVNCKDKVAKDAAAEVVIGVLQGMREDKMAEALEQLTEDEQDVLMKYVYRGLSMPTNNGSLLKWHSKVVQKAGIGCIVRAMVDRKSV
jgi:actin related protein 2/3 complex subunit 5